MGGKQNLVICVRFFDRQAGQPRQPPRQHNNIIIEPPRQPRQPRQQAGEAVRQERLQHQLDIAGSLLACPVLLVLHIRQIETHIR